MAKQKRKSIRNFKKGRKIAKKAFAVRIFSIGAAILLVLVSVVGITTVAAASKKDMLESFRYEVRSAVETMTSNINTVYDNSKENNTNLSESRDLAIRMVSNGVWNNSNRGFWALETDGTLLAKVENGDTDKKPGDNVWDLQDADGKFIEREIIAAAKQGGGFVDFRIQNEAVSNAYIAYALPTEFGFVVDATFDMNYFESHWSEYVTTAVAESVVVIILAVAVILLIIGTGMLISKRLV
ncbi:MAG: cache domain-containing protein [Candidatus Nomurabacteria bacterium]|jgi:methyl-accepting chemotaxis protein|nr:cache domain-containing protein [Candidatus Nomurabacteria bacterium]